MYDYAVALIEKYRGHNINTNAASIQPQTIYVPILIDVLMEHGHPIRLCSAAYKWWRYRQAVLSLLKRWRRLGLDKGQKRELDREARMTMVILAGFYHSCREWYEKKLEEEPHKRWRRDLYAALVDAAARLHAYLQPCMDKPNLRECIRARIEDAAEGAHNPLAVYQLLARHGYHIP